MTTRDAIEQLYRDRDKRIIEAYRRGVKKEQIAMDEDLSVARIWQIIKEDTADRTAAQEG